MSQIFTIKPNQGQLRFKFYLLIYLNGLVYLFHQINKIMNINLSGIVLDKINQGDFVHKVFLKPIELVLKTNRVDDNISSKDLPQGIMQALKINGIADNTYEACPFPVLNPINTLEQTCEANGDNLISFLKAKPGSRLEAPNGLELAICVCMYSEDRLMLKDSIKGIEDNVARLISSGVNPDSIAVFVIMDGIEKVNNTVVDYFQQLERESHIFLGDNNLPSYTPQDIEQEIKLQNQNEFSPEQFVQKNMNSFLFSQPELDDRESRRFINIRKEYLALKQIKKQLVELVSNKKNEKIENIYDKIPQRIKRDFWLPVAKEYRMRQLKKKYDSVIKEQDLTDQVLIDLYAYNSNSSRVIANEAINKAIAFINKYVATRDDLCYLASFRKQITLPSQQKEGNFVEEDEGQMIRHMNLFMCVKYKNAGKLSSHNWFFNGFCRELNPAYTILMDVGLKPEKQSIFKMYDHMRRNPEVGGVCGYMRLKIEQLEDEEQIGDDDVDWLSGFTLNFVDIQKAQQMEYNLAHVIDKPFESAFGFIHVLPGAFSGYNMKALGSQDKRGKLLKEYFRSIEEKLVESTVNETQITFISVLLRFFLPQFIYNMFVGVRPDSEEEMLYNENIYFAEDRILCMQIHKNGLELVFLPDALAEVDPIKTVHGLMGQRKRWINGSYFAFEKVKKEINQSNKFDFLLRSQVLFYDFMNIIIYFAPAIFFFTIHISMKAFRNDVLQQIIQPIQASKTTNDQFFNFFVYTIDLIYAITMLTIIYYSLNTTANKPIFKPYIYFVSTVLGLLAVSVLIVFLVDVIRGLVTGTIFLLGQDYESQSDSFNTVLIINRWIVVGVFAIYFVPLIIYTICYRSMKPLVEAIKGALSFIFYNPTYFIILSFYALCRIDDISWGTKGLNQQNTKQSKMQQKWRLIKLIHVCKYAIWNIVASVLLLSFAELYYTQFYISFVIMISIVLTIGAKILIGSLYLIIYKCKSSCKEKQTIGGSYPHSQLNNFIQKYKTDIEADIFGRIRDVYGEIRANANSMRIGRRRGNSMIMGLRNFSMNRKINADAQKKYQKQQEGRSKIIKSYQLKKRELPLIREEEN